MDGTPAGVAGGPRLVVVDAAAVSGAAADEIARALSDAVARRGVAHWATTGGSAAPGFYGALRSPAHRAAVDWVLVHTWWGDDRFVPSDHPQSNVLPFNQVLRADEANGQTGIEMAGSNVHTWPIGEAIAGARGRDWCALRYAESLEESVPLDPAGTPVLDLIVLGVGPDGHILSVFPGSAVWDAPGLCAGVPAPTHIEPHIERVTMHPRLVAAARAVLVVASGSSKAEVLAKAYAGGDPREIPSRAARVPQATWVLDQAAAAALPR